MFKDQFRVTGKPTPEPKKTPEKSPVSGKSAVKGTAESRKTKAREDELMSRQAVEQRDRLAEIVTQKSVKPIGENFLKLESDAKQEFARWTSNFNILRNRLLPEGQSIGMDDSDTRMPQTLIDRVDRLVRNSFIQHRDLMNAVVDNLRATHVTLALIDRGKAIKADNKKVLSMIDTLDNIQKSMITILGKGLEHFTAENLKTLKSDIDKLRKETVGAMEDAVDNMDRAELKVFKSQLEIYGEQLKIFDEMTKVFDNAQILWTGSEIGEVTETNEELAVQMDKDKGITDILNEALEEIRNADIKDAKYWRSVAAIIGLVTVALVLTALLVGLLASGTGAIVAMIVLASLAGFSFAGTSLAGGMGFLTKRYEYDYELIRRQLDDFLKVAPPLLKDLKDLQANQQA